MTYKINYDSESTLVLGKYPCKLYETCPLPFIKISDAEYAEKFGSGLIKRPCVVNGKIQEFVRPDSELLQEAKTAKLAEIKAEAARLITSHFKEYQQLNILMSGDSQAITDMKNFIEPIRTKSNQLEANLEGLNVDQINNFPIIF